VRPLDVSGSLMTNETVVNFLRSWVSHRTGLTCTEDDDLFVDSGLDSLDFAELLDDVERGLNLKLDIAKITNWDDLKSIRGLAAHLGDPGSAT